MLNKMVNAIKQALAYISYIPKDLWFEAGGVAAGAGVSALTGSSMLPSMVCGLGAGVLVKNAASLARGSELTRDPKTVAAVGLWVAGGVLSDDPVKPVLYSLAMAGTGKAIERVASLAKRAELGAATAVVEHHERRARLG